MPSTDNAEIVVINAGTVELDYFALRSMQHGARCSTAAQRGQTDFSLAAGRGVAQLAQLAQGGG